MCWTVCILYKGDILKALRFKNLQAFFKWIIGQLWHIYNGLFSVWLILFLLFTNRVVVKMKNLLNGNAWLWERGKFMNRRFLIQVI